MLELLSSGSRILNIDETWIGETNFTWRTWQSNESNSTVENTVYPRVSMIAALDNFGELYLSLMQHNTNQFTFCHYLSHLVE